MFRINIKTKLILMKLLRCKFVINKDILKPKINKDVGWLV